MTFPTPSLPSLPLPTILLLIPLYPLLSALYNLFLHPLRAYPGPLLWRATNLGKITTQLRGDLTNTIHAMHKHYGPVVRVAPGELSYITAQAWKDIYTAHRGVENTAPNIVYGQSEREMFGAHGIMWQVDEHDHGRHRRALAPAFADRSLREQEGAVLQGYVDLLMTRLKERSVRGEVVDLGAWFNFVSFDVIGDLVFGEGFGCLERGEMHPWVRFIFGNLKGMMYDQALSALGGVGVVLRRLLVPGWIKEQVRRHAENTRCWVMKAMERKGERPGFMMHFAESVGKEGGISFDELIANANLLVMAGSETLATQLAATAYYVLKNPEVARKLREEVRGAFEREEDLNFAAVSAKLPYVSAVLSEAIRMHPPVPVGIHKLVRTGGAMIDGRWVAGGTDVAVHQWSTYRSSVNFKDADSFVPERWLGDERYVDDNREAYQPFGVGPRNCIGRGLAFMEARLVLARLVWNFDMEWVSGDWPTQKTWILYEKGPLCARLTPVQRRRDEGGLE